MSTEPDPLLQSAPVDIYRNSPDLSELCERLVGLDEGVQYWRYRHLKIVERTFGAKAGTGGSSGATCVDTVETALPRSVDGTGRIVSAKNGGLFVRLEGGPSRAEKAVGH